MIIRVNFRDNDLQHYFENFFKQFRFKNYYAYLQELQTDDKLEEWRKDRVEMEELLEKSIYKSDEMSEDDISKFTSHIRKSIIYYLKLYVDARTLDYLNENLLVEVVSSFTESWENDEVLYYFINADKYIIQ